VLLVVRTWARLFLLFRFFPFLSIIINPPARARARSAFVRSFVEDPIFSPQQPCHLGGVDSITHTTEWSSAKMLVTTIDLIWVAASWYYH
jgi:hypothetical protein